MKEGILDCLPFLHIQNYSGTRNITERQGMRRSHLEILPKLRRLKVLTPPSIHRLKEGFTF